MAKLHNIHENFVTELMKYHVVILNTASFLEKASYRISNIFSWPVRISGAKCLKPEINGRLIQPHKLRGNFDSERIRIWKEESTVPR